MKYAIISDVHGNYPALELVIEDAMKHRAQEFLFVGDYCISIPWPREVVESVDIHMAHSSEMFIGKSETREFSTSRVALRYADHYVTHEEFLEDIQQELLENDELQKLLDILPVGVYIFGHTHIQWHMQVGKHLFINPGSCGLPLDCKEFGAPYTLLTVENGAASIEECRIKYDVHALIERVKSTEQYEKAPVWNEVIFKEWLTGREKISFFLQYVEDFARRIGDERRPFAHDTWQAAYEEWGKTL